MIDDIKDIASENPIEYIWKNLRYFQDDVFVSEKIKEIHKNDPQPPGDQAAKKQAVQIGFCIRQAEEYFRASSQVGIATRPLLLYYGASTLAKALVLLRQDGSHSFDALRKSGKHKHHGLELSGSLSQTKHTDGPEKFFSSIDSKCYTQQSFPWGHFSVFYASLVPPAYRVKGSFAYKSGVHGRTFEPAFSKILGIQQILNTTLNALSLMKGLPDLYDNLVHFNIRPDLLPGKESFSYQLSSEVDMTGAKKDVYENIHLSVYLYCESDNEATVIASSISAKYPKLKCDRAENTLVLWLHCQTKDEYVNCAKPAVMTDIEGTHYFVLEPDNWICEPASLYILLYQLGMISRYHADIWMKAIDNVRIAELADTLLNVAHRKFPNLMLDQLTDILHFVRLP